MNVIRTAATLIALAALAHAAACCDEFDRPYPTVGRDTVAPDGRPIVLYGADSAAICETIADHACESLACRHRWIDRCNPRPGADPRRIESASLEGWDNLWRWCIDAADRLAGDDLLPPFDGFKPIEACWRLTPYWSPVPWH